MCGWRTWPHGVRTRLSAMSPFCRIRSWDLISNHPCCRPLGLKDLLYLQRGHREEESSGSPGVAVQEHQVPSFHSLFKTACFSSYILHFSLSRIIPSNVISGEKADMWWEVKSFHLLGVKAGRHRGVFFHLIQWEPVFTHLLFTFQILSWSQMKVGMLLPSALPYVAFVLQLSHACFNRKKSKEIDI